MNGLPVWKKILFYVVAGIVMFFVTIIRIFYIIYEFGLNIYDYIRYNLIYKNKTH